MRRLLWIVLLLISLSRSTLNGQAQDALNLPSELYILQNSGIVQRYGIGTEGVSQVTPDDAFVLDFRVAPDANWIAYRTDAGLVMRDMFAPQADPILIEDQRASVPPLRGNGETIAWSPDSKALAYTTEYGGRVHFFESNTFVDLTTPSLFHLLWSPDGMFLAAEAQADNEVNVWWIFQRQAEQMILRGVIPGAYGGDWLSANRFLYAGLQGGMTLFEFTDTNQQIQILNTTQSYYAPNVTADGQIVAFVGQQQAASLIQITLDTDDFATTTRIGSTEIDLTTTGWTPDGFLLTAFQGGVLALINPINGNRFSLPLTSAVAYSWGAPYPKRIINSAHATDGYFIAPDLTGIQQVWQLPRDGSRARTITAATQDITEFALSFNRQQIAYVSNSMLYRFTLGSNDDPIAMVELGINSDVSPAWSPDNKTIFYRDEQGEQRGIWQVGDDDQDSAILLVPDVDAVRYTQPNPASGVGAMVLRQGDSVVLADTTTGEVLPLDIIGAAEWQNGTELLALGALREDEVAGVGLYAIDSNQDSPEPTLIIPLLAGLTLLDYRIIADDTLRLLVRDTTPGQVRILDMPRQGGDVELVATVGYMVNPRLSLDGAVIVGQRTAHGALLIYDVAEDSLYQLDVLPPVQHFIWQ